jgi:peptidyl-prolyl cis-trans isomerase C
LWAGWLICGVSALLAQPKSVTRPASSSAVLVRVDGQPITEDDFNRLCRSRRIPEAEREPGRAVLVDTLIDVRLLQKFLAGRKIEADPKDVDEQIAFIRNLIKKEGDVDQVMADLGYTEKSLREEVALPLAWRAYLMRAVTDQQIRDYFESHRQELDGTQVRASHIFIKVPSPQPAADLEAARGKLAALRADILAGKMKFAEAAREHSEAPSRDQGGDVGFFAWQGKMPEAFSRVAFALKKGELSEPFATPFGMHLCTVTDRKPGELSLEDARADVMSRVSQELWTKTAADLRRQAKIDWPRGKK